MPSSIRPDLRPLAAVACGCLTSVLAGCGTAPALENLRCQDSCQSPTNPLIAALRVDIADAEGRLKGGRLVVTVNEKTVPDVVLPDPVPGTLDFNVPVTVNALTDGAVWTVAVQAVSGDTSTNTAQVGLRLRP